MQDLIDMDLAHDETTVCLTIVVPKSDESQVVELLGWVSRAFADTERVREDWMHAELERRVKAYEDATHFKFIWERHFWDDTPHYPQTLAGNLAKYGVGCSRQCLLARAKSLETIGSQPLRRRRFASAVAQ